ncbi:uncharacterized protein perm1b [Sphaeramia orbicularis]|uniref:uncharacterized protein perm1b n=1 Tax=Sphaeramia orbicularis TaxID=375764 RepID=UPI00117D91A9|nr:uncharacterized protein LOC115419332 [Sphaeramia orbicularis]
MDDLDHSMHIADYDWVSFYEECEECSLLQPSLACPDNSSLSDSEDSENHSSVFNTGRQKPQQSPAYDGACGEGEGCSVEDKSCSGSTQPSVQFNQRNTGAQQTDLTRKAEEDSEDWSHSGEVVTVESSDETSTELQKGDGDVPQESDTSNLESKQETDPSSCKQTDENMQKSCITDGAVSEDVGPAGVRAERERWFVTVNDSPARQRICGASVKKKRRPKKTCKDKHMFKPGGEICFNQDINTDKNEPEGERDKGQDSGVNLSAEIQLESFQTGFIPELCVRTLSFLEQENMLQEQVMSHSLTENASEPTTDAHKAGPKNNISTLKDTPLSGSVESDEFEDGVEFLSTHSYDSESYLSASESVEGHLYMERQPNLTETDNVENTQDRGMHFSDSTPLCNVAAISCHESTGDQTHVEPTQNFPSANNRANKMPDDNSTCNDDTPSPALSMPSDTPEHQAPTGFNLSASGCSIGDQPGSSPLPAPEFTVTPCSVTDSPETYAEAVGNTRPVYAISAFWDEMEKLTINDILQLRMGRSTPPRETYDTQETVSPNGNAADAPTHNSSVVDSVDYNMSDSGVMDTSDAADSDYFTQLDESKPDRSSCDFSTSDFEEEYWQYISASRNPSPDLPGKSQQTDSDFLDEEGSIISEGKDTPVPLEDFEGHYSEDQDSDTFSSCDFAWPRQITKSKSMHNVHALITNNPVESLSLQSFQSSHQSVDENMLLKMSDSLEIVTPAPILSYRDILDEQYQISFPEVVEHFFTENNANYDAMSVAVYDLDDISVDPVYKYTTDNSLPFASFCEAQCAEQKPIPIFTCSHPTVRELTFPKPDYVVLAANCVEEDDISPIRVVSHSLIQDFDLNTSAADKIGSHSWKSLLSIRKIRFHDKGSIWCRRSGAWVFPAEDEKKSVNRVDPLITVLGERRFSSAPSQLFRELTAQQSVLEALQTSTNRQGIFSTIKQSDMCLVCIAFASWVLKSSDPEATDTWKAALLANVSALSAIQYLRQYVKKKPPQDDA